MIPVLWVISVSWLFYTTVVQPLVTLDFLLQCTSILAKINDTMVTKKCYKWGSELVMAIIMVAMVTEQNN